MRIIPCSSTPNAQNEIACQVDIDFFKTKNGKFPVDRSFEKSRTETYMVIFENTPEGVQKANAVLFNHLLRQVMPKHSVQAMQQFGYDSLNPEQTITDQQTFQKFLSQMMFMYICGSEGYASYHAFKSNRTTAPYIFAHASSVPEYIDEFYNHGADVGFYWNVPPTEYLTADQIAAYRDHSIVEEQANFQNVIDAPNFNGTYLVAPELLTLPLKMNAVQDFIPMNIIQQCSIMKMSA